MSQTTTTLPILRRHFAAAAAFLFVALTMFAGRASAQVYPCTDNLYFSSYSNTNVYRYKPSTNAITQVAGYSLGAASAASAITPDGSRMYYADSTSSLRYNSGNATNVVVATGLASNAIQRNGISPTGTGYFMVGTAGSTAYYTYTTGGATSTVSGPFNLTLQPSNAPALGNGGDITFDTNGVAYLLDQAKNFYRLDFSANTATYIGAVTGMGSESPNGMGFSLNNSGTYELYASTLNNLLYKVSLTAMTATQVSPSSTVGGFTQNDIASCIYPPNITPNITAVKAWRNVTKGDPATFATSTNASLGDVIEYRVVVRNSGTIAAGNVTFTDTIPTGMTYVAASTTLNGSAVADAGGTGNAAFFYKTAQNIKGPSQGVGALAIDSTPATIGDNEAVVVFRVTVNTPFASGTANPIPNTAQVNYAGSSGTINSNTTNTTVSLPDLIIDKSHTGNFLRGSTGIYTFVVTNQGTSPTVGLMTVTDNLPAGLTVNNGLVGTVTAGGTNGGSWTCTSNALSPQSITCISVVGYAISNVAGSNTSTFTLTVNVAANAAASVTNNVSVSGGGEPSAYNTNNTDADVTLTAGPPNVVLTKTCLTTVGGTTEACSNSPRLSGTDLNYTIAFTNSGGTAASNLIIIDALPTNTDFKVGSAASSPPVGVTVVIEYSSDYNGTTGTWTYTPTSLAGGAPAGYDRLLKATRWRVSSGTLAASAGGSVSFTAQIR